MAQLLQMRARIYHASADASLRAQFEISRAGLRTSMGCLYLIGSSETLLKTLSMRARIISGDSSGLPCVFLVEQARTQNPVKTVEFGSTLRAERIISFKARIIS